MSNSPSSGKCPNRYCEGMIPLENYGKTESGLSICFCAVCSKKFIEERTALDSTGQTMSRWVEIL